MTSSLVTNFATIPSFKDDMRLRIHIASENFITQNSTQTPLFHGSFETPALVPASVFLELDKDAIADELTFEFSVCAGYKAPIGNYLSPIVNSEKPYCRKVRKVDLQPSSSEGKIAAGTYSKSIRFETDPSWPSSLFTVDHVKGQGWVRYEFKAVLRKKAYGGVMAPVLLTTKEIWVLNSTLSPLDILAPTNQPHTVSGSWIKNTLPVSISVPSKTIHMNEHVPVTVNLGPLKGKCIGESIVVSEAYISLKETISGFAKGYPEFKHSRDVVSIPIVNLTAISGSFTKSVHITFPNSPDVSPYTETKYLNITHSIVLTMIVKVGKKKERETIESSIKFMVGPPQNNNSNVEELLPSYESVSDDTTQLPPSFQSASDDSTQLPSYLQSANDVTQHPPSFQSLDITA